MYMYVHVCHNHRPLTLWHLAVQDASCCDCRHRPLFWNWGGGERDETLYSHALHYTCTCTMHMHVQPLHNCTFTAPAAVYMFFTCIICCWCCFGCCSYPRVLPILQITLEVAPSRLASEYYTREEMVQFKKSGKKKRVRKKKFRADDLLPLPESVASKDHGSR